MNRLLYRGNKILKMQINNVSEELSRMSLHLIPRAQDI
jgi:hypothetical protein